MPQSSGEDNGNCSHPRPYRRGTPAGLENYGVELRDGVLRFLPGEGNIQQYLSTPFDHSGTRQTFADDFLIDERNGTMSFEYVDQSRGISMPVTMPLFMVG